MNRLTVRVSDRDLCSPVAGFVVRSAGGCDGDIVLILQTRSVLQGEQGRELCPLAGGGAVRYGWRLGSRCVMVPCVKLHAVSAIMMPASVTETTCCLRHYDAGYVTLHAVCDIMMPCVKLYAVCGIMMPGTSHYMLFAAL